MPRNVSFVGSWAGAVLAAGTALVLVGCATSGDATEPEPTAAVTAAPTPVETPTATPTVAPVAVDPADVSTWTITTSGIGPIQRGASAEAAIAELTAFESEEYCPGIVQLSTEGSASMLLTHPEGADAIGGVWANGRADAEGVVPASPKTETGVALGSTMDELAAAYPDLAPSNQTGAESYGYAAGDEASGYLNFLVENDVVVMIGVQDRAGIPKEFCG
ncbi:hypothetical protein PX701_10575 [Agromyces sp. H3Y2-19a]|uniref:hypothetical protein n=1 Tax=Agromyces TaxID=33877 RepID=UPI001E314717|nr:MULTISPECIES: hypothetical protein [Agromyces]MCD5348332.1 hypothetical protein [Agromyces sp. S2-1-8]MDF0514063.1 hypothetical protein [Agromyces chromiiresistens]